MTSFLDILYFLIKKPICAMIIYNRNEYSEPKPHQYKKEKHRLQIELLKLQEWVVDTDQRIAIVFEGRDAAGKGSTIKRFIENLMPKAAKIIELGVPSKKQERIGSELGKKGCLNLEISLFLIGVGTQER